MIVHRRKLDAGSWFGEQLRNERIPTFQEVLERYQGRVYLHTEVTGARRRPLQQSC